MVALTCMISPSGPVDRIVEVARAVEAAGARRVWLPDEGLHGRDVHATLAAVAGATTRVEVGPGITNPYTRHPGVTAGAVATIDELSGGRGVLGVGAGGGLALGPLAIERREPIRRMAELIDACRALWAGDTLDTAADRDRDPADDDGDRPAFRRAHLDYGRADIPIWVGGRGPRVTALAGERADGFMLSYVHLDLIGDHVGTVRQVAAAAGRPTPRLAMMTSLVTDDVSFAAARTALTFRLADSPASVRERIGLDDHALAALRAALAAGGPAGAAHLVSADWVRRFTLVGDVSSCARQLRELLDAHGIDEFQMSITDLDRAETTIEVAAAVIAEAGAPG